MSSMKLTINAAEPKTCFWTAELRGWLETAAREAGFAIAGVAKVRAADDPETLRQRKRYASWIEGGRAGEMEYLKRRDEAGVLLRGAVSTAFPWARSAIVCAFDYSDSAPRSIDPAPNGTGWIARYVWSSRASADGGSIPGDYHDDLLERLRRIEVLLRERAVGDTRSYVDTGPLVERTLAAEAGIGWTGKNTCVINQRLGSWLLLGVILTSLPVEDVAAATGTVDAASDLAVLVAADRCGTCTRCIDACPTGALLGSRSEDAPREMDASRCIAYLTIEKKGDIDEEFRAPIGRNIFGCDICQEVCPWNAKAARSVSAPIDARNVSVEMDDHRWRQQSRMELVNPPLDWLAQMNSREFRRHFSGSPLERTGRKRLLRNVAIAMGNSGDASFIPQLEQWANSEATENRNDVALRDASLWAVDRIRAAHSDR